MSRLAATRLPLVLGLVVLGVTARGDEQKIPLSDVPRAVIDAIKAKFPRAELKEASKETADGKTTYEVSLKDRGADVDVTASAGGKIVEIERTIDVKDIPRVVTRAIEAKYPKSTVKSAEVTTAFEDDEEETSYEAQVVTADGKTVEVTVDEKGKIEEEGGGKDKDEFQAAFADEKPGLK